MSVYPLVLGIVFHDEGFENIIQSTVLRQDSLENRVSNIFELQEGVLQFIVVFKY